MSDGCTINTPCKHKTGMAIRRSANHRNEVGAQLGGRRHTLDIEAHTLGVSFGRLREVGDKAIQIFNRERTNAKLRGSSVTKTHMIQAGRAVFFSVSRWLALPG